MNRENVRFYIGSLPDLVDALDVEGNAHEVVDVALEVENDAPEVDDDQEVVPDVQEVVIDVQEEEIDVQEVDHSAYLAVDHEEVVFSESFAPSEEEWI